MTSSSVSSMERGAASPMDFGRDYLPHYFTNKSPPFHRELCTLWKKRVMKGKNPLKARDYLLSARGLKLCIAAPRGHAKSTVMSLQNLLHSALYGYKKYIIIVSDTESQAKTFLEAVKAELEFNAKLIEDFGEQKSKIWKSSVILLKNGCRIDAIGSRQKLRGRRHYERRPDLILLDDIENDGEIRTAAGREKLAAWFFSAVSKAGDRYTDIVFIGTVLHHDSLLSKLLENPAYMSVRYKAVEQFSQSPLWEKWRLMYTDLSDKAHEKRAEGYFKAHRAEMLMGTKVLWPQKLSYYELMCMRLSEGEGAFNREMQNMPIDPEACLFPEGQLTYYNPAAVDFAQKGFCFFGFCDPSLGKTANSDFSAIITIARNADSGLMYVLGADLQRRHPNVIIDDIIEAERRLQRDYGHGYTVFGAETNQFQWFLKEQLAAQSAREGVYLPICEVRATTDKLMRVQTLQPYVRNGYLRFDPRHTELLAQLRQFPLGSHDDGPDALEGCVSICKKAVGAVSGLKL